jgi:hypothetical protein
MSYTEFSNQTRSQKIILAHLEARQRVILFTVHSGDIYKRTVDKFVVDVTEGATSLIASPDLVSMTIGSWFFDPSSNELYVWTSTGVDPKTINLYTTNRFFFSNIPCNHLSDITSGSVVHYDALINDIGDLKLELDYENTGIALETNSTISLQNTDGFFDGIFDTIIWENQSAKFWSWNRNLEYTEAKVLYDGIITDKSFSDKSVKFTLKDQLSLLKETIVLPTYSLADGEIEPSMIGKPKRIIFGRVDKIKTQGVDKVLNGYSIDGTLAGSADRNLLVGTVSGTSGLSTVTGSGTSFIGNLVAGSNVTITSGINEYTYTVDSVASNTSFTISGTLSASFAAAVIRNTTTGSTELVGTVSGTASSGTITGVGTTFLTSLAIGTRVKLVIDGDVEYIHTVTAVANDLSCTVTPTVHRTFSTQKINVIAPENNFITGTGTSFLSQVSPRDTIIMDISGTQVEYAIEDVFSDTTLIVSDAIATTFTGESATVKPSVNYRRKNRDWHIAGHKLRQFDTFITVKLTSTIFGVDDISDIELGDKVRIDSVTYTVTNVSGTVITINQALPDAVTSGYVVTKIPLLGVYFGTTELVADRDYTLTNADSGAIINLDILAETNVSAIRNPTQTFSFVSGRTSVVTIATNLDCTTILKPRDWVRIKLVTQPTWYEVLKVEPSWFTIRANSGLTYSGQIQIKSPNYIGDEALIAADCLGLESDSEWIRYPSQAVQYLLGESDATNINTASFDQSTDECPYLLSLFYPTQLGGAIPNVRDMIATINKSVFGSLYLNDSFQFSYSVLNADRDGDISEVSDDDILSFSVQTKNQIINQVSLNYSPYIDLSINRDSFQNITLESDFVNQAIGKKETLTVTANLYRENDAQRIAERWLFFRGNTQSVVTVKSKLNLTGLSLNDKMHLNLDRLYTRFSGSDRRKIGIVNSIIKNGSDTEVEFNDLGNLFNRVAAITDDSIDEFISGSSDVVMSGYMVDNITETPDPASEEGLGSNLMG